MLKFSENQHTHNTRTNNNQQVSLPQVNTTSYGLHSVIYKAAKDWNFIQHKTNF